MSSRLSDTRLFIADLAQRLANMECGRVPMHPLMYRVLAKRLREAVAGFPDSALRGHFGPLNGPVEEVLEDRHFNTHGQLGRASAPAVRRRARRCSWPWACAACRPTCPPIRAEPHCPQPGQRWR